MKLKIADKWKWYAVDAAGSDEVFAYTVRPEYGDDGRWDVDRGGLSMWLNTELFKVPDIKPGKDSLHEILEDGTLVKWRDLKVDDWVPKIGIDKKASYYDAGGIHVLEIIKAKLTPEQFEGYLLGNAMKYSLRANFKGCFGRDCEKMQYYSKLLSTIKGEEKCLKDRQKPIV